MDYQTDKYFTPDIEDIRVGYECEFNTNNIKLNWIKVIASGPNQIFENGMVIYKILEELTQGRIKVPYLTKEQIEAEGWGRVSGVADFERTTPFLYSIRRDKNGSLFNLVYNFDTKDLIIDNGHTYEQQDIYYNGKCKDINTFRYICKLLNIE